MNETNTYKKLKDKPRDNHPEFIVIHHTGGTSNPLNPLADTSHHTASGIEAGHLSLGWEGLGYHYVIHKDGDIWKGRPEHYHGAHVKEDNINTRSIGICLAGNFDVTLPTQEQEKSLVALIKDVQSRYKILSTCPHRYFLGVPPYKSCYGKKLPDDWFEKLTEPDFTEAVGSELLKDNFKNTMNEDLKKRIKSLLWRASMMGVAAFVAFISENITGFGFPVVVTTVLGLTLGEVSKFLNTGIK